MGRLKVLVGLGMLAGVAVGATGIAVGQDVIAQRKELMKGVGGASKTASEMVKGEKPYDAKAAETAMSTIAKHWVMFAKLFPDNSKTGGDTTAAAKIWEDPKGFEERGAKMAKDAEAAAAAAGNGLDAFKASFSEVAKNCKGCHEGYRIPKK